VYVFACALGIAPRLTSLAVVRGDSQTSAGSLSFVWPRSGFLSAFDGDSIARAAARRSLRTRVSGAALTDLGVALLGGTAVHASGHRGFHRGTTALASAGALAVAISVPIQFAADGQLSRAVFHFNQQFAR
jgi:hypothetical protein